MSGPVAAIVLAAGESTRMGRPKPLLRIGDGTYLETVVGTLSESGAGPVLVVLGHEAETVRQELSHLGGTDARDPRPLETDGPGVSAIESLSRNVNRSTEMSPLWVTNPGWRTGMLGSIQAGLRVLVDLESAADRFPESEGGVSPIFDGALVAPVDIPLFTASTVSELIRVRGRTGAGIVVPTHGGRRGHPVLFGRELWAELFDASAERGAVAVVHAHGEDRVEVAVADPWILRDADTPSDHRRLIADARDG